SASLHADFATVLDTRDQFDAARHHRRLARRLASDTEAMDSSDTHVALVDPRSTHSSLLAVQSEWVDRQIRSRPLVVTPFVLGTVPVHNRRIRIGYLYAHPDVHFFKFLVLPLVAHHNPSRFEVFAYVCGSVPIELQATTACTRRMD